MTADELADILDIAFAESGQKPGVPQAAIWLDALGSFPAADVRADVIRYCATHKWPPKASEIVRRLRGFDEHATTRAVAFVESYVTSGKAHLHGGHITFDPSGSPTGHANRADPAAFPDAAAYDAYVEIGPRAWYDHDVEFMRKRFAEVYERHAARLARPAIESPAPVAVLPDIGKRVG